MSVRKAGLVFVTAMTIALGTMLGMSALVGLDVHAAKQGDGYGIVLAD